MTSEEQRDSITSSEGSTIDRSKPGWWKEYYQQNKAKVIARNKAWMKANDEKMRPKLRAKWRRRYARNADKIRSRSRAYRKQHAIRLRAANREWQKGTWETRRAHREEYYQRNKERIKAKCRANYHKNKGAAIAAAHKRRALREAAINLRGIKTWVNRIRGSKAVKCYYCRKTFSGKSIHFDHIIPLSKGGPHSVDNLCVACQPCNSRKHARSVQSFVRVGQQLLSL